MYYTVMVASQQYHGKEDLTYGAGDELEVGQVVLVPLQKLAVIGVVTGMSQKPRFATKSILEIYDVPRLPRPLLRLAQWLQEYYPAPAGIVAQQILPSALTPKTIAATVPLSELSSLTADSLPPLRPDQISALSTIDKPDTYVLHGDTGSGKTRVYIELAMRSFRGGRSAIILTPEISLTSQLAGNFRTVFGERVVVIHSGLTPKARQQLWIQLARSTEPVIIVGPRSALFSPLPNIGLIVVDEAHEPAYKQDSAPHYHAVRVAAWLSAAHHATLILGSATPLVADYYLAQDRKKQIIRMHQHLPEQTTDAVKTLSIDTINLTDRSAFSRSQYLSTKLLHSIDTSLKRGEQSLLYLNRRGTARVILCNVCGWQATCPHCDLPLTYHHDLYKLQCHTCGWQQSPPTTCPDCGNTDIVFKVVGTKAIEEEVRRLYPSARIMRFDTDNKKAERFEHHYDAVHDGDVDIIIGTQLLAKGLDLPRLSTLGVVIADTSLTFPDFSAEERTYQLLAQVIGRVGRGHRDSAGTVIPQRVIVQSYDPTRPVIAAALARDYDSFYKAELEERRLYDFPPYCHMLKLSCRRASTKAAEKATETFADSLADLNLPISIEGPMPSFHARSADKYEWQIIIKTRTRSALLTVIHALPKSGWTYDIDPMNLL